MTVTDELRKTLTDPKPLYALAGAGDLAAEKLKDAPALLTEVAGNVTTFANKIAAEAPERIAKVQARLSEVQGAIKVDPRAVLDPKAARTQLRDAADKVDTQVIRDRVQSAALIQVGRMLEAAGKAVETYEGLASRGKTVVDRYRGETPAPAVTVVVEQVTVDEPESVASPAAEPEAGSVVEDAVVQEPPAAAEKPETGPETETEAESSAPAGGAAKPRKTAANGTAARKRATAPKSTPKS
jgi:hypothetical protein